MIGPSTSEAVVSLIAFVVVGSLTIAGPVVFYSSAGIARRRMGKPKWAVAQNAGFALHRLLDDFGIRVPNETNDS